MPKPHVPNGKTQVELFHARSRARTADIQRRSQTNQALDEGYRQDVHVQEGLERELHKQSAVRDSNAQMIIVELLQRNAAWQRTVARLAEAWGPEQEKALDYADAVLESEVNQLSQDEQYNAAARDWAQRQVAATERGRLPAPKVSRKRR